MCTRSGRYKDFSAIRGMAKIRIYFNPAVPNHVASKKIVLKFGRATGMKMTDITPANMYHQVEDEEE